MIQLRSLDELVPIQTQLGESVSPVVLINIFHVGSDDADALLKAWEVDANWMKKQPGGFSPLPGACLRAWQSVRDYQARLLHHLVGISLLLMD